MLKQVQHDGRRTIGPTHSPAAASIADPPRSAVSAPWRMNANSSRPVPTCAGGAGAAARASHGVLFLDEAPEFPSSVLDALRQPLESGVITIHRANAVAHFPGRFQLVMAANPCPCGQYGARDSECTCPPHSRRRYIGRLSGPLLDRIDIQFRVQRITAAQLRMSGESARMTSADAASRCAVTTECCGSPGPLPIWQERRDRTRTT